MRHSYEPDLERLATPAAALDYLAADCSEEQSARLQIAQCWVALPQETVLSLPTYRTATANNRIC